MTPTPTGFSARLARLTNGRPGAVLLAGLISALALVPLVLRLRLDTDVVKLAPQQSAEAQAFARFARSFVTEQVLIVLVESEDPAKLAPFADRFAARLAELPGVAEVRHRLSADSASFVRDHLLGLLTPEELAELAPRLTDEALAAQARRLRGLLSAPGGSALAPILTNDPLQLLGVLGQRLSGGLPVDTNSGYFRSPDGHALLVYVRPDGSAFDVEADRRLIEAASRLAREEGARVTDGDFTGRGLEIGFTGACAYTLYYRDWLHRDASLSTPVTAVVVLLLFAFFFRSVRVMPLVAVPLFFSLAATAAFAALIFGRVNAVSLTFGTVLLSIGVDFPIQFYNRLREEMREAEPRAALLTTTREMLAPSATATLGPAIVFLACALSDYRGLTELGILAGVGLVFNLVAMFTVFPALLAKLPPRWWMPAKLPPRGGAFAAFSRLTLRAPRATLLVAGLLGLAALPLASKARFDERMISIHPPSMPPVRTEAELSRRFGERERMLVALVEEPTLEAALQGAERWTAQAAAWKAAGLLRGVQSISSLFPSEKSQAARRAALAALDPGRAADALGRALDEAGFDVEPFQPFLERLRRPPPPIQLDERGKGDLAFLARNHVSRGDGVVRVATFFFPAEGKTAALADEMRRFAESAGGVVTGAPVLERALREVVVRDTLRVTAVSVAGVVVLLLLSYRRLRAFLVVLAPLSLAWVFFAAALGLFGLPLNLFNLLVVPLIVGYGIDDHVFLLHRYLAAPGEGVARAVEGTGRAIVLTSVTTLAGFGALGLARFDGLRLFGLSGALAVGLCLLTVFLVLPALIAVALERDQKM